MNRFRIRHVTLTAFRDYSWRSFFRLTHSNHQTEAWLEFGEWKIAFDTGFDFRCFWFLFTFHVQKCSSIEMKVKVLPSKVANAINNAWFVGQTLPPVQPADIQRRRE